LEEDDIRILEGEIKDTEEWLIEKERMKEDYEAKLAEVNGKVNPIMMKVYSQGQMPSSTPASIPESTPSTIEEMD